MRYRKKPVAVEALQWTGSNPGTMYDFTGLDNFEVLSPDDVWEDALEATAAVRDMLHEGTWIPLHTGDWVIKGVRGEFYPCRQSVFEETYEPEA